MNYNWDIKRWIQMYLSDKFRKPNRLAILEVLVSPIKDTWNSENTLYNQFLDFKEFVNLRTRYNRQQGSLKALLNKLFDPELKRIYLVTENETIATEYGNVLADGSDKPTIYGNILADGSNITTIYGYTSDDYANNYNGYIYVPISLSSRESEIRKWVDYNVFGKNYNIIYF